MSCYCLESGYELSYMTSVIDVSEKFYNLILLGEFSEVLKSSEVYLERRKRESESNYAIHVSRYQWSLGHDLGDVILEGGECPIFKNELVGQRSVYLHEVFCHID